MDRSNEEENQWNQPTTSDGLDEVFSQKDIPVTSHDKKDGHTLKMRTSANDTLEKSLTLLRDVNQSTLFVKKESRAEDAL